MKNFSHIDHVILARGIFIRWNRDVEAAVVAWRRLFQNSCTLEQFKNLLAHHEHTEFCEGQCKDLNSIHNI